MAGVRLRQEAPVPASELDFRPGGGWELVLPRPPVARLEYLLEVRYAGGDSKVVTDPANPRQVPGAFGPKSVLEFPGYAPPGWLAAPADPGTRRDLQVPAAALSADQRPDRGRRPVPPTASRCRSCSFTTVPSTTRWPA